MIGKRGQGAMEYLMTYGWAILVVMVVGIVMWQLGIFNLGGVTATTASGFPRIKPQLALSSCNTSGYFKTTFTNGAGGPAVIQRVTVKDNSGTSCSVTAPPATAIQGTGKNFDITGTCATTKGSTGDPYDFDFTITYNVSVAGAVVPRNDVGSIRGPME
jgi:hypothetical protein